MSLVAAGGMLLLGMLIAGAAIIWFETKSGHVVVKDVPENAEATFDREKLTLRLPGQRDPVAITEAPNGRAVSVKKGLDETTGEEVTIATGGEKKISARLEPRLAPKSEKDDPNATGFVRLFNGSDLAGWRDDELANVSEWKVEDKLLVGYGAGTRGGQGPAWLSTKRSDYEDFLLHVRVLNVPGAGEIVLRRTCNNKVTNGYTIHANGSDAPIGSICKLVDHPYRGRISWDVTAQAVPIPMGEWYALDITSIGNRITTLVKVLSVVRNLVLNG